MKKSVGVWQTLSDPKITEILCLAGFDWIVLDMEHSTMSFEAALLCTAVGQRKDVEMFIRVPSNDPVYIKRSLDIGIDGIIIPRVDSEKDAKNAMSSIFYPPSGSRGVGLSRAQDYGYGFEKYRDIKMKKLKVFFQIESYRAIDELEAILKLDKLTGTMIGPYDLSGSIGVPGEYDNDEVQQMLNKYKTVSENMKVPFGFHIIEPDGTKLREKRNEGYSILALSLDTMWLFDNVTKNLRL
jgi:2-dehydro-3-deoxyglucarate aldolase